MFTYWIMFIFPALMTFIMIDKKAKIGLLAFFGLFLFFMIGFRYQVGGDWFNYLRHYNRMIPFSFTEALLRGGDVGHDVLNWIMIQWDMGVYGVNVVYAMLFSIGLVKFCMTKPQPWLAMTVSIPYLVIVVAMGYSRQGVAIGLFIWAINFIEKGDLKKYIILIMIAALFHKTALLMMPLGLFIKGKSKWVKLLMVVPSVYGLWDLLLEESQDALIQSYVTSAMVSEGAKIRVYLNLVPSILFLLFRKRWQSLFNDYYFWLVIALGTFFSVAIVDLASTAVDRMALYFLPIQLVVFSRLPLLMKHKFSQSSVALSIVVVYFAVQYVWLTYAKHAIFWFPYQNLLFG